MNDTITVIGSGYVGTTLSAVLANAGYTVYALDLNKERIESLKSGKVFFYEIGLEELVNIGLSNKTLIPTTSYEESIPNSDIVFSCVGTPDNSDGSSNLNYIFDSASSYAKFAKNNSIYVQRSTVPVGTGRKVIKKIAETNPNLVYSYVSNPEFLREGSALYDTLNPSRIITGSDSKESSVKVLNIFRNIKSLKSILKSEELSEFSDIHGTIESTPDIIELNVGLESAELIKVTANAFLALKISFANNIALLADATNSNVKEIMDGIGYDSRIGRSLLYPGLGWGGGCFPKDVSGLIHTLIEHGVSPELLDSAVHINDEMIDFAINKIMSLTSNIENPQIGILGLTFKPGTSDMRRSQSIRLANKLIEKGFEVKAYDPMFNHKDAVDLSEKVTIKNEVEDVFNQTNIVVIATDWTDFKKLNWIQLSKQMRTKIVLDARNILSREELESMGYRYEGIGQ